MAPPPEQVEVDLGRYVRRVTSRWYIVVACVLAAIAVAALAGTNSKKSYRATTLLYLGLPVGANGAPLTSSLCTNPATPGILLKQEAVLEKGAEAAGLETSQLRGRASTAVERTAITKTNFTAIVRVIVVGPWRLKAQQASNALAQAIREECGGLGRERQNIFRRVIGEQEGIWRVSASSRARSSNRSRICPRIPTCRAPTACSRCRRRRAGSRRLASGSGC